MLNNIFLKQFVLNMLYSKQFTNFAKNKFMNNKITSFRNFLGLFLLFSLFSITATAQTVVFSENFNSITSGNSTETGGSSTVWNGNANIVVDGTNSKAYQAGGAVRIGTGSAIGYITTIPIDLSQGGGNYTINFDVKGWSAAGTILVIVKNGEGTTIAEETVAYTNAMSGTTTGPFESKTLNLTGGVANATIRFETILSKPRAFIDNIIVTVPEVTSTLEAPVATAATIIADDSFTANWEAVTGATDYRLDVSTTSNFTSFVGVYNDFAVTGTSQQVTGLSSNTTYYYRVRAIDANETSVNSNVIAVITECGPFTLPDLTSGEYCPGSTVADLPLSGEGGYNWFANEADTTPLASNTVLVHGTTYYLQQTINSCDSEMVPYVVNVIIVEAPVYAEPEIEVCNGGTIADITPLNSGYQFYTSLTAATPLAGTEALVNGSTLFVSRIVDGCESERTEIMIEIEIPLVPEGAATQVFTEGQTLADLAVTADEELVWYAEENMETELDPSTPLVHNTTYYAVNNDAGCMSAPLAITAVNSLSAGAFGMEGLVAYPNPVNNMFTITYKDAISNVTVYNMLGQAIITNSSNAASAQVNMSAFAAGTYIVKVVSGSQSATFKVVKQ